MDLIVKQNAYKKLGLSFEQFCYLLSLRFRISPEDFHYLFDRRYIDVDEHNNIKIGGKGYNTITEALRLSTVVQTDAETIQQLAETMATIFPTGKKPGTSKYWKGNSAIVIKKLTSFFKKYGLYSPDVVIKATEAYVKSFGDETALMRILPYFIEKDGESDLLTFIENLDQVTEESPDFTEKLV